jgi:hypothetical protein
VEKRILAAIDPGKKKAKPPALSQSKRDSSRKRRAMAQSTSATQADAFAGSEREEKSSACSGRNDSFNLCRAEAKDHRGHRTVHTN